MSKLYVLNHIKNIQYQILFILSVVVLGMIGLLAYSPGLIFQRFIGVLNPILIALLVVIGGFGLLSFLLSKGWFVIYRKSRTKEFLTLSLLAISLALVAILIDWKIKFPADMNVLFPESLLFYPAIGFIAEIIFHVIPVSILIFLLSSIYKNKNRLIGICIFIGAIMEPTYQVLSMSTYPAWAIIATWINLFVFNLAQLSIFKKYDFISMYAFRLIYYFIWHIIWGQVRLNVLF